MQLMKRNDEFRAPGATKAYPKVWLALICAAFAFGCVGPARADILFKFEDQSHGTFPTIVSTVSGLTATLLPNGGSSIDVVAPIGLGPASWLNHSLLSYYSGANGFIVNFSATVSKASFQFGDYGVDDDSPVIMTAFAGLGGTGAVLGMDSVSYPASQNIHNGDSYVGTVSVSASGINSIVVTSGGPFPGSMYWGKLSGRPTGAAVPEPATWTMVAIGVVVLGLARRRTAKIV